MHLFAVVCVHTLSHKNMRKRCTLGFMYMCMIITYICMSITDALLPVHRNCSMFCAQTKVYAVRANTHAQGAHYTIFPDRCGVLDEFIITFHLDSHTMSMLVCMIMLCDMFVCMIMSMCMYVCMYVCMYA
jgi:hypothetical protein